MCKPTHCNIFGELSAKFLSQENPKYLYFIDKLPIYRPWTRLHIFETKIKTIHFYTRIQTKHFFHLFFVIILFQTIISNLLNLLLETEMQEEDTFFSVRCLCLFWVYLKYEGRLTAHCLFENSLHAYSKLLCSTCQTAYLAKMYNLYLDIYRHILWYSYIVCTYIQKYFVMKLRFLYICIQNDEEIWSLRFLFVF